MGKFQKIDEIIAGQAATVDNLKREIDSLKQDDVYAENAALRLKHEETKAENAMLSEKNDRLDLENKRLKNEMFEQLFNEKTKLVELNGRALDAYFASSVEGEKNRLNKFEEVIKLHIDKLKNQMEATRVSAEGSTYDELGRLREEALAEINAIRQQNEQLERELLSEKAEGIKRLKEEPLTDEQIARRGKQNNFEVLLGLKVLNRLGVFLMIVGVTAAVQFTYTRVPDIAKGILVYLFGLFILGLGRFFGRKEQNVFSIGLTSGGVAIFYVATALCFFMLHVIGMYTALLLCVLITAAAFALAQRYNSQTVATFAIIGGYLPLSSIADDRTLIYFAMLYFIILNIFSLMIAGIKKWYAAQFIGFVMNAVAVCVVVFQLYNVDGGRFVGYIAAAYVFFAFLVYSLIPLLSSWRSGLKLVAPDNVMLILNTIIGSAGLFGVFALFELWDYAGVLSVGMSVLYLAMAKLIKQKMTDEKSCRILFYITGLMFAVLVIPLQFGVAYLSLGWLIEGVFLLCYGILSGNKTFRLSGIVISGLCLYAFIAYDFLFGSIYDYDMFFYKYLFITLGSLLVLASMIYKGLCVKIYGQVYKCAALVNFWFYLLYAVHSKIGDAIELLANNYYVSSYTINALSVTLSLAFAYIISRFKPLTDKPVRTISIAIDAIAVIMLLFANTYIDVYADSVPLGLKVLGTIILVIVNSLSVLSVYELVTRLALKRRLGVELIPIVTSGFFVILLMQNLIRAFELELNNLILTAIIAVTAVGWIIFGFLKRYHYIRLCGLVLSFVATVKLFVFDLGYLTAGLRIVSYFMMGVAFLAISFIYQYFSKRLERFSGGESPDEE